MNSIDLKLIIVGDCSVGKTAILTRFVDDKFEENPTVTISPIFSKKIVKSEGIIFNINLWDLPGQDRNPIATNSLAKDSNGIIYCCDISNSLTRDNLKAWEETLKSKEAIEKIPKIIIENKCDLFGDENNYNDDLNSLRQFSKKLGCINFFRTSAKNGYNVKEAIDYLIYKIIKEIKEEDIEYYKTNKRNSVKVKKQKSIDGPKCC